MVGRPTKCTPAMIDRVCELLKNGISIKTTCELVGISQTSFNKWKHKGEAAIEEYGDHPEDIPDSKIAYVKFLKRTTRAGAKAKAVSLKAIRDAGNKGDWKAHKWYLEHCHQMEFGKKQHVDITTDGERVEGPVVYLPAQESE